jgi:hypothetical protein
MNDTRIAFYGFRIHMDTKEVNQIAFFLDINIAIDLILRAGIK